MEGNLHKWTNYVFGWRQRYFVLRGSVLLYYIRKGERAKGRIHLSVANLNVTNNDYRFEIDSGTSIFYLRTDTKESKDEWIKALKIAKFESDTKINNNQANNSSRNFNGSNSRLPNDLFNMETNRNTNLPEDKLTKKIIFIKKLTENLGNLNLDLENFLNQNKQSFTPENYSYLNDFLNTYKKETKLVDYQVEDMKLTIMRFAADFTRLSEYFGPDDYDRVNYPVENLNNVQDKEYIRKNKGATENINSMVIEMDQEVFYGLDDSLDHKVNSVNDNVNNFITNSNIKNFDNINNKNKTEINIEKNKNSPEVTNMLNIKNSSEEIALKNLYAKKKNKFYEEAYNHKRTSLPCPRKKLQLNVWGILKEAVSKDLSKFCVPVHFNEPLSMLQRFCENFQYASLLNRAAKEPNPHIRLALTGAFCISSFAFNIYRTLKFFNPLLTETYEYIDNDLNFRFIGEQVSHHPAISAYYAEGDGYYTYGNSNSSYKFQILKGSLEFTPLGKTYVHLENFNETLSYIKPHAVCRNLIMGTMHLDAHGKFNVTNHDTGDILEAEIYPDNNKEPGKVIGESKDIYGNIKLRIEGNWHTHLDMIYYDNTGKEIKERIWEMTKIEGDVESKFYFNDFTVNLNNINDELKSILPPSDSRFRPDQRALEVQDLDMASSEKHRLEEKQRKKRKENEKKKIKHTPLYFEEEYDDLTGELIYKYKGGYFEDRKARKFDKFSELY